jgi:hypothetical protein
MSQPRSARPGGAAVAAAALLSLVVAVLVLAWVGVAAAVSTGIVLVLGSYAAAVFAARAARRPPENEIRPDAGDPAAALRRRVERSAAALRRELDTLSGPVLRDQLEPVRREVDAALDRARELAVHVAAVRAPLAGLDPTVPEERAAAERLVAVARSLVDQLASHAAHLDRMVADVADIGRLAIATRGAELGADGEERLHALRAGLFEAAGGRTTLPAVAAEADFEPGAKPATIKADAEERTG